MYMYLYLIVVETSIFLGNLTSSWCLSLEVWMDCIICDTLSVVDRELAGLTLWKTALLAWNLVVSLLPIFKMPCTTIYLKYLTQGEEHYNYWNIWLQAESIYIMMYRYLWDSSWHHPVPGPPGHRELHHGPRTEANQAGPLSQVLWTSLQG